MNKKDNRRHRTQAKSFDKINIGDEAQFSVEITEKIHNNFAELFKDFSPIHSNDKFCAQTKFKKKIGYAFMLTGLLSRLYGKYLPGGNSICIKQEAMFIKPFLLAIKLK